MNAKDFTILLTAAKTTLDTMYRNGNVPLGTERVDLLEATLRADAILEGMTIPAISS